MPSTKSPITKNRAALTSQRAMFRLKPKAAIADTAQSAAAVANNDKLIASVGRMTNSTTPPTTQPKTHNVIEYQAAASTRFPMSWRRVSGNMSSFAIRGSRFSKAPPAMASGASEANRAGMIRNT